MNYLHYEWNDLTPENVIEVTLDKQANVRLLDGYNYRRYKNGESYEFKGGLAVKSPICLGVPGHGELHLVIDLEGYEGRVGASVRVL